MEAALKLGNTDYYGTMELLGSTIYHEMLHSATAGSEVGGAVCIALMRSATAMFAGTAVFPRRRSLVPIAPPSSTRHCRVPALAGEVFF